MGCVVARQGCPPRMGSRVEAGRGQMQMTPSHFVPASSLSAACSWYSSGHASTWRMTLQKGRVRVWVDTLQRLCFLRPELETEEGQKEAK